MITLLWNLSHISSYSFLLAVDCVCWHRRCYRRGRQQQGLPFRDYVIRCTSACNWFGCNKTSLPICWSTAKYCHHFYRMIGTILNGISHEDDGGWWIVYELLLSFVFFFLLLFRRNTSNPWQTFTEHNVTYYINSNYPPKIIEEGLLCSAASILLFSFDTCWCWHRH